MCSSDLACKESRSSFEFFISPKVPFGEFEMNVLYIKKIDLSHFVIYKYYEYTGIGSCADFGQPVFITLDVIRECLDRIYMNTEI